MKRKVKQTENNNSTNNSTQRKKVTSAPAQDIPVSFVGAGAPAVDPEGAGATRGKYVLTLGPYSPMIGRHEGGDLVFSPSTPASGGGGVGSPFSFSPHASRVKQVGSIEEVKYQIAADGSVETKYCYTDSLRLFQSGIHQASIVIKAFEQINLCDVKKLKLDLIPEAINLIKYYEKFLDLFAKYNELENATPHANYLNLFLEKDFQIFKYTKFFLLNYARLLAEDGYYSSPAFIEDASTLDFKDNKLAYKLFQIFKLQPLIYKFVNDFSIAFEKYGMAGAVKGGERDKILFLCRMGSGFNQLNIDGELAVVEAINSRNFEMLKVILNISDEVRNMVPPDKKVNFMTMDAKGVSFYSALINCFLEDRSFYLSVISLLLHGAHYDWLDIVLCRLSPESLACDIPVSAAGSNFLPGPEVADVEAVAGRSRA